MLVQTVSNYNNSSADAIQQKENIPFLNSFLFAPCNLVGRVCEHWREIALIAATALCVMGFVLSFLSASFFMCMNFALIGSITMIAAGEMRDLGTLHDVTEGLKDENNNYKLNNLRHHLQIQTLSTEVQQLGEKNSEYLAQNTAHQRENEEQKKNNEQFALQVQTYKESFGQIQTAAEQSLKLLKERGVDSVKFQESALTIVDQIAKTNVLYQQIESNIQQNYQELAQTVSKEWTQFYSKEVKAQMIEETKMRKNELEELLSQIQTRKSEAEKQQELLQSQIEHLKKEREFVEEQQKIAKMELEKNQKASEEARKTLEELIKQTTLMNQMVQQELRIQSQVGTTFSQIQSITQQTQQLLSLRTGSSQTSSNTFSKLEHIDNMV